MTCLKSMDFYIHQTLLYTRTRIMQLIPAHCSSCQTWCAIFHKDKGTSFGYYSNSRTQMVMGKFNLISRNGRFPLKEGCHVDKHIYVNNTVT